MDRKWVDTTEYDEDRPRRDQEPLVWTMDAGPLRVTVHRRIDRPRWWFVSCPQVQMDGVPVGNEGEAIQDAKEVALHMVFRRAQRLYHAAKRWNKLPAPLRRLEGAVAKA